MNKMEQYLAVCVLTCLMCGVIVLSTVTLQLFRQFLLTCSVLYYTLPYKVFFSVLFKSYFEFINTCMPKLEVPIVIH